MTFRYETAPEHEHQWSHPTSPSATCTVCDFPKTPTLTPEQWARLPEWLRRSKEPTDV